MKNKRKLRLAALLAVLLLLFPAFAVEDDITDESDTSTTQTEETDQTAQLGGTDSIDPSADKPRVFDYEEVLTQVQIDTLEEKTKAIAEKYSIGVGIITTAAKAGLAEKALTERIYRQMAALNKAARDVMVKYPVHSCTDVTGFALLGHSFEMAQGSGVTVHIQTENVPFHKEAWAFADMGLVPSGAYRNRDYAEAGVRLTREIARPMQDILYDPQTSGGLLIALPEKDAARCLDELRQSVPQAAAVGYVTEKMDAAIYLE